MVLVFHSFCVSKIPILSKNTKLNDHSDNSIKAVNTQIPLSGFYVASLSFEPPNANSYSTMVSLRAARLCCCVAEGEASHAGTRGIDA